MKIAAAVVHVALLCFAFTVMSIILNNPCLSHRHNSILKSGWLPACSLGFEGFVPQP